MQRSTVPSLVVTTTAVANRVQPGISRMAVAESRWSIQSIARGAVDAIAAKRALAIERGSDEEGAAVGRRVETTATDENARGNGPVLRCDRDKEFYPARPLVAVIRDTNDGPVNQSHRCRHVDD